MIQVMEVIQLMKRYKQWWWSHGCEVMEVIKVMEVIQTNGSDYYSNGSKSSNGSDISNGMIKWMIVIQVMEMIQWKWYK